MGLVSNEMAAPVNIGKSARASYGYGIGGHRQEEEVKNLRRLTLRGLVGRRSLWDICVLKRSSKTFFEAGAKLIQGKVVILGAGFFDLDGSHERGNAAGGIPVHAVH